LRIGPPRFDESICRETNFQNPFTVTTVMFPVHTTARSTATGRL